MEEFAREVTSPNVMKLLLGWVGSILVAILLTHVAALWSHDGLSATEEEKVKELIEREAPYAKDQQLIRTQLSEIRTASVEMKAELVTLRTQVAILTAKFAPETLNRLNQVK